MGCCLNLSLGDLPQIMADNAPTYPALHPTLPMIQATVQFLPLFQPMYSPFGTRSPVAPSPEPTLTFICLALRRLVAWFGQANLLDPFCFSPPFVIRTPTASVRSQQFGGSLEHALVLLQARLHRLLVCGIAFQHLVAADYPAFCFVQPDHPPILSWLAQLALADNCCLWLKDADQLVARWHHLSL